MSVLAAGLVVSTMTATAAASGPTAGLDLGDYAGPRIVQVAEGTNQNMLALDEEGGVWGWGLNASQQVTGTTTAFQAVPVRITAVTALLAGGEKVTQLAAASSTSYALTSNGRVISWGANTNSALGRTTAATAPGFVQRNASTQLTGITQIDGGQSHALALDNTGHVWAWGLNNYAQLGINNLVNQQYAVQIPDATLNHVTDISAGWYHSLAVSNGKVKAWGYGSYGGVYYLGVPGTEWKVMTPTAVVTTSGMTANITTVEAGISYYDASYAIDVNGQLWSWGINTNGALGHGSAANVPNRVLDTSNTPLTGVTRVTSGYYSGYAVVGDSVYAWGWNNYGQLGIGSTANAARATKVKNFDLGGDLGDVESIAAGWYNLAVISSVGDDEGVLSVAGHNGGTGLTTAAGAADGTNSTIPKMVWRFEQAYKQFPDSLVPRSGATTLNGTAQATRDPGDFNVRVEPFELTETTDATVSYPVDYTLSGSCSLDASTKNVSVASGALCTIVRSFSGTALVAPLPTQTWTVTPGKLRQDIAAFTEDEGGLFHDLTEESTRVALPILTDDPANQGTISYTVTEGKGSVCTITLASGADADGNTANVERYLVPLADGDCTVTAKQAGNSNMEALDKTVEFSVAAGRPAQSIDLSALTDKRYKSDLTLDLPTTTDKGQPVSYSDVSGDCELSGSTTLTVTGAGDCVVTAIAPGRAGDADTGALPYAQRHTISIGLGIQKLDSIMEELTGLVSAASDSEVLPATSKQGLTLTWGAETASSASFPDACRFEAGRVYAGVETERDADGGTEYAECIITAQNAGNDDWEPFSYSVTVEISERDLQTLSLADHLDGKKFGDAPFDLPEKTDEGQTVIYEATGSCTVDVRIVTIEKGGACVVTATAPGTVSGVDEGPPYYRPLRLTTTAPVAKAGQQVAGMPQLIGLKVGATSGSLPTTTLQGMSVTWSVGSSTGCAIVDGRVLILSDDDCDLTGSAPGDGADKYSAFSFAQTFAGEVNTDALRAAIDGALPDTAEGSYTEASWDAYQVALAAAEAVLGDPFAEQAEVDAALAALTAVQNALVDISALTYAVENAATDEDSYTPETWSAYEDALADAQAVLDDPEATQGQVDAAREALADATAALVQRADFSQLEQAIGLVEALPASGTGEGEYDYEASPALSDAYDALQDALADAQAVFADTNSTQAEVDAATEALQAAFDLLESAKELADQVGRLDELALNEDDYTPESWAELQEAIDDAKAALSSTPVPDQATIDALLEAVREAQTNLEFNPQQVPGLDDALAGPFAMGDEPVALPTTTDRGAEVTYTVDPASADVCSIVDGKLVFHGVGTCSVTWTAPAVGDFPASSGTLSFSTGAGLQLVFEGIQLSDGSEIGVDQTLTARGAGLEPGSTLRVELHSDPVLLGTATVASDGTASVTFGIPANTKPGNHTIYALGVSGVDQSTLTRTAEVSITSLARTGAEVMPFIAGGVLLLVLGGGLLLLNGRRRRQRARD